MMKFKNQIVELNELKEHVFYLLNCIHDLRSELKNLANAHKKGSLNTEKGADQPNIVNDLNKIADRAQSSLILQLQRSISKFVKLD